MNKKLILNVITLSITAFLLVLVVFSWYVSNKEVSASGIIASTAGEDYTLKLQRGTFKYDKNHSEFADNGGWYWEWEDSDAMTFSDIQPGDAFFFRIVVSTSSEHSFDVSFNQIQTTLMENTLEAYINQNLVAYTKTTDTTAASGKTYYKGTFTKDTTITVGDVVKPYTYYNLTDGVYSMTTDKTFAQSKDYYKAKFTVAEEPDFSAEAGNTYYEKGTASTTNNAIGYKYTVDETEYYNYLYPLDSEGKVKTQIDNSTNPATEKVLYTTSSNTVSLKDYLIEDTFKVYDIGSTYKDDSNQTVFHGEDFKRNDFLYNHTAFTQVNTATATFDSKKTYYVLANQNTYSDEDYVVSMDTKFETGTTYYERTAQGTARYNSSLLKTSSTSFSTDTSSEETYYYFALEFNDALSLEEIYGVKSSNCYLYQKLRIAELQVSKTDEE